MNRKAFRKLGFTLIELLVLISIIGLLASVTLVALNNARLKARDTKRKQDVAQIANALELYYNSYGSYPVPSGGVGSVCNPGQNAFNDIWCRDSTDNSGGTELLNWIPGLNEFASKLPRNPKPYAANQPWPYHYLSDGKNYWIMFGLENTSDSEACPAKPLTWTLTVGFGLGTNMCATYGAGYYVKKSN